MDQNRTQQAAKPASVSESVARGRDAIGAAANEAMTAASSDMQAIRNDLNGLKETNDLLGHAAGDELLRRVGEVLGKLVEKPAHAARIGGDEFAIIMPGADEAGAEAMIDNVHRLVELNNQFYSSLPLTLSMGAATGRPGERLDEVARRADALMYEAKRAYYQLA